METEIFNAEKHREDWLKRVATKLLKVEEAMPVAEFVPEGKSPPWVERVEQEIGMAMFPVAKLKKGIELTPLPTDQEPFDVWFSKLRTLTKFALCSCVDQTHGDTGRKRHWKGYSAR